MGANTQMTVCHFPGCFLFGEGGGPGAVAGTVAVVPSPSIRSERVHESELCWPGPVMQISLGNNYGLRRQGVSTSVDLNLAPPPPLHLRLPPPPPPPPPLPLPAPEATRQRVVLASPVTAGNKHLLVLVLLLPSASPATPANDGKRCV